MRHIWLGRKHESVFEDSCIDRYQLALDMLITAKSSSWVSVAVPFLLYLRHRIHLLMLNIIKRSKPT